MTVTSKFKYEKHSRQIKSIEENKETKKKKNREHNIRDYEQHIFIF